MTILKFSTAVLGVLLMTSGTAVAQESDQWEWTLAPYLWATDAGLDLSVSDQEAFGGNADFKDLLDKVDTAFMGRFEGRKGRWGVYLDTIYLDLSDNRSIPVGAGGPVLGDLNVAAGMKLKLYDAGGIYRVSAPGAAVRFDVLAGLRYVDQDVDALITLPGPGMTELSIQTGPTETDVMLGGRFIGRFSDRWNWVLRGDLSFGGTEGTYNGLAAIGYTFGESGLFSMELGYRYMSIEVDGTTAVGRPTTTELTLSGPVLGLIFIF